MLGLFSVVPMFVFLPILLISGLVNWARGTFNTPWYKTTLVIFGVYAAAWAMGIVYITLLVMIGKAKRNETKLESLMLQGFEIVQAIAILAVVVIGLMIFMDGIRKLSSTSPYLIVAGISAAVYIYIFRTTETDIPIDKSN